MNVLIRLIYIPALLPISLKNTHHALFYSTKKAKNFDHHIKYYPKDEIMTVNG